MSNSNKKAKEEWKDIKDYEGLYQVSNLGNVKALDRVIKDSTRERTQHIKSHILKPTDNGRGYQIVSLNKNGRKNKYVHRLVAEAFIDNPENKKEVNHKDLNKKNNCVDNLEWINQKENKEHYRKTDDYTKMLFERIIRGRKKYAKRLNLYKNQIIKAYKQGNTIEEINLKTGISKDKISKLLRENNIEIRMNHIFKDKLIVQKDRENNVLRKYDNYTDIIIFVREQGLSKATNITIRKEIHDAITKRRNNNFKYGYYWEVEKKYEK